MFHFIHGQKRVLGASAAAVIVALILPARLLAQFGGVVFDPTSWGELVRQYVAQLQQFARQGLQLQQEIQSAENSLAQLRQAIKQAEHFGSKQLWQSVSNQMWHDQAQNVLGETVQWNAAINGAQPQASAAWLNASTLLKTPAWLQGQIPTSPNVSDVATVEVADTTSVNSIRTLADLRNAQVTNEQALQKLENDALAEDDDSNVQVKQLNLQAAGTVQMLRSQQNVIDVLGYQLEQQMIANKPVRDGMAGTLSRYSDMYGYIQNEPTAMATPRTTFAAYQVP
jgi:type IV secretion system protein TrbJ